MRAPASRFPVSMVIKPDTRKTKYSEIMDNRGRSPEQLFLILKDLKYEYCLYRIYEPGNNDESSSIVNLGEPLLKMEKSTYPDSMSFVALGTSIYMVGGYDYPGDPDDHASSNKMFICDTASDNIHIVRGPNLVSGKVLDTHNLERGWSLLPAPPLRFRGGTMLTVVSYAAVDNKDNKDNDIGSSSAIFITLSNHAGTYAFDVDNKVWDHVSRLDLPFYEYAMPCAPSLYYAASKITARFSAFRFCYNANNRKFRVDEIKIHNSSSVMSRKLLPPPRLYHGGVLTAVGPSGRVYDIKIGFDHEKASLDPKHVNRYVKVNAVQVYSKKKMKRHTRIEEKEKEKDENVPLKRCKTTTRSIPKNQVEDGEELKMSRRWTSSIFGGPMVDIVESMDSDAFAF